jgi:hypothetical protein
MKKLIYSTTAVALLSFGACKNEEKREEHATPPVDTSAVKTENKENNETAAMPDSATMQKAWQDYMTPGDMHKWLASANGKWEAEVVSWMSPDAPPTPPSKVKVDFKMINNGLYQESTYSGDMMGMRFEGKGLTGYDNARKKFVTSWTDNMGSGILHMEGDWDEASKSISYSGKSTDPISGKQGTFREVHKVVDDKHHTLEMYGSHTPGSNEFKMLEIRLAKK